MSTELTSLIYLLQEKLEKLESFLETKLEPKSGIVEIEGNQWVSLKNIKTILDMDEKTFRKNARFNKWERTKLHGKLFFNFAHIKETMIRNKRCS